MLTTLVRVQYLVAWWAARARRFESLITNPPRLLYYDGAFLSVYNDEFADFYLRPTCGGSHLRLLM